MSRNSRHLVGLVTGVLLALGLVAAPSSTAAPPRQGSANIQVTKVTPDQVSARIRCGADPNPDGTQYLTVRVENPDGTVAMYQLDVARLCDLKRHRVTVPYVATFSTGRARVGTRVDVFATISGDSGEYNSWYEGFRVRR